LYKLVYRQSSDRTVTIAAISRHFDSLFECRSIINEGCSLPLFVYSLVLAEFSPIRLQKSSGRTQKFCPIPPLFHGRKTDLSSFIKNTKIEDPTNPVNSRSFIMCASILSINFQIGDNHFKT
jgi:hypothetical protein